VVAFLQQFFNGLVSGAFLALLALGLSVIFGMLGVLNFAHGAFYMLGAFGAYILHADFGVNFWVALLVVPPALAVFGMVLERAFIHRLTGLDPLYNFLLTLGWRWCCRTSCGGSSASPRSRTRPHPESRRR